MFRFVLCLMLCIVPAFSAVPVIFDTDMGNDVDDALAIAMIHTLEDRGECKLLGVTLTNAHKDAPDYIHMVNRFYGRPNIAVGAALRAIKEGDRDGFLSVPLQAAPVSLRIRNRMAQQNAVVVLRRLLAESKEKVVLIQVGFSTNLAALLDSPPDQISNLSGKDLVKQKVSLLSTMAGEFTGPTPEYNVRLDIPSAKKVFEEWPTPIVFSGFEIGRALKYPALSIEKDYKYVAWHPIEASYRAYAKMPYDRPTWDLTSVLYAVRPDHGYFDLSEPGAVTVDAKTGSTAFAASAQGNSRYLKIPTGGNARILEALTMLSSQPPLSLTKTNKAK